MKSILLSLLLFTPITLVYSQGITSGKTVPTTYDRASLAVFYLDITSGNHDHRVKEKIKQVVFSDKFDNNNYRDLFIPSPYSRGQELKAKEQILQKLNQENVGKNILAKWYNRQPDGMMSLDLIHQRGRFSATDSDYLRAQSTKRGSAALEDFGNRLVNLSYILVVDVYDVRTVQEAKRENSRGWVGSANGYLFKIDFNDDIRNAFYETWIYEDDNEQEKERKRKLFEELQIPINFVTQVKANISANQPTGDSYLSLLTVPKTEDQLLQELAQKSYDEVLYLLEMQVEDLRVKTPIFSVRPIRAKIGLKEGLRTDHRFFAYEFVYNERTKAIKPKRRGVVRATSDIVDNRQEATGQMGTSRFYQTAGRRLEPGFTLQQKNDFGIEVLVGGEFGTIGGLYGRVDYRTGRLTGVRSLFLYIEGGIDASSYDGQSYGFTRYAGGLAKGFQLTRNIEARFYGGYGMELSRVDNENIQAGFVRGGLNLALNLRHNIQLVGGVGAHLFVTAAQNEDGAALETWGYYFPGRAAGGQSLVGLRVGF